MVGVCSLCVCGVREGTMVAVGPPLVPNPTGTPQSKAEELGGGGDAIRRSRSSRAAQGDGVSVWKAGACPGAQPWGTVQGGTRPLQGAGSRETPSVLAGDRDKPERALQGGEDSLPHTCSWGRAGSSWASRALPSMCSARCPLPLAYSPGTCARSLPALTYHLT